MTRFASHHADAEIGCGAGRSLVLKSTAPSDRPGAGKPMTRPRVAVVGAGPAGSTAARLLAERGADVTLIEARRLPRPKLCGGGLTPKSQRLVPAAALAAVERRVHRVEIRGPHLRPFGLDAPDATIAMVDRSRFDLALAELAAAAGADILDGTPVRDVVEIAEGVVVLTDSGRIAVDAAVIADGEPSTLSRRLGLGGRPRRLALALEAGLPFSPSVAEDTAVLSFGLRGGYGWYFPKGDHASVGVGSHAVAEQWRLREELARLAAGLGLDVGAGRVRGHWIPMGLRAGRLASDRVVLAGDAAAAADAMFGEGIPYALLSGMAAAQVVGDWAAGTVKSLSDHDPRLRRALAPALGRLGLIAVAAEASISTALLAVRLSTGVRERAIDAIAGRAAPFVLDTHCDVACACDLHGSPPGAAAALPRTGQYHCVRCTATCAA